MDSPSELDQKSHSAIRATQLDGTQITSSVKCELKKENAPQGACKAYKFTHLAGNSLIFFLVFADQGCNIILDKYIIVVTKDDVTIVSGYREKGVGFCRMPF